MAHQPCAIVGIGQTHHKSRRWDVSLGGLVREAASRALEDAQMDWADIDAVVLGKAPDLFEGIMKPELYLTDALGAAGKPMFRVHTAGSVGGATGIVASHLIESGRHPRVLALGYQKQSEGNAQFALGSARAPRSAPAAPSLRSCAATSTAAAPPPMSARWSPSRIARTR
jgi:acetyl-CoA C-acetyltransferase